MIALTRREYKKGDLGRAFAAIASTDDRSINLAIQREAKEKNILLNIVDKPEFCSFVFPARMSRGEFMITVSTGGASPAFAKKIREDLEKRFGVEYELLTRLMFFLRKRLPAGGETGRLFNRFVRSPILTCLKRNDWAGVNRLLRKHFGDGFTAQSLGLGRKS
jgi:precorrin-2 dehydrogenase/sirohydrochlorin ferrochelatase